MIYLSGLSITSDIINTAAAFKLEISPLVGEEGRDEHAIPEISPVPGEEGRDEHAIPEIRLSFQASAR